jgi:multidrug efflux pump subunit AcrA (membrane-fusion protein)
VPYQDSIEIIEGLNEGEKVVTRGNERLRSNQKVQIEETK